MKRGLTVTGTLAAVALASVLAGCDTDPVASDIWITPPSATIKKGESIEFTAHGGYEYLWSISDTSMGILSTTRGASTVYTSIYETSASNTAVQVLTVTSYIAGDSSSTNTSPVQWTAAVNINHVP